MIATNNIDLTGCFMVLDDGIFDKICSGLIRKLASPRNTNPKAKGANKNNRSTKHGKYSHYSTQCASFGRQENSV